LTGAAKEAYKLPYTALKSLIEAGVSCNACLMVSFSDEASMDDAKNELYKLHPGILKSLELERIKLFPKVRRRITKYGLKPNQGVSCAQDDIGI